MIYDERFGLVERGTKGHRASAQVVDVGAEIRAMHRIMSRPVMELGWGWRALPTGATPGEFLRYKRKHGAHATGCIPRPAQQVDRIIARARVRHGRRHGSVSTASSVEGDTLRIVHTATAPARVQTINVNVTIGGEE